MKIKFIGLVVEQASSGGCCGNKKKSTTSLRRSITLSDASNTKNFQMMGEYEVSESFGTFLLKQYPQAFRVIT
ncbi:hypothetical protein FACS189418_6880 [Clostridia bacterium]|nr:hypothetical protein FACS189418_6880 [Clostridia bacterium]